MASLESPEAIAKEGYDAQAQRYLDWALSQPSWREKYTTKVFDLLPDPRSAAALELGCGAGIPITKVLAERCGTVVANDISSTQVSLARKNLEGYVNVSFVESGMNALDFPDDTFDLIFAFYSIIHLDPEGQKTIFEKIRHWLKPGGLLLVNLSFATLPDRVVTGWHGMKSVYWSSFGHEENTKLITESGFEILTRETTDDENDSKFSWFIAKAAAKYA